MFKATSLLASAAVFSLFTATPTVRAETNFGQVAMYVAYMLQNHHYSHQPFNDEVSKKLLAGYIDFLDFGHIYFTEEDINKFKSAYETTLDDHILNKNISPAIEIYDVYEQRVKERVEYVKELIKNEKFTFDSMRTVTLKRDKVPWAANSSAHNQLWKDLVESDLLAERLADISREESRAKKAAEKKANEDAKKAEGATNPAKEAEPKVAAAPADKSKTSEEKEETPEERVLKRYEQLLEQLAENDQEDIVNYFLSSLATSYDPHTEYMSQQESDNFKIQMNHSLVGIGALLSSKDNVAEIQGIVVGGPADKQGELKLNDRILAVAQGEKGEWVDIKYMKLQKIVEQIRGKTGTTVRLKVNPAEADDPAVIKEISIVRGEVELKEKLANAELIVTPLNKGKSTKLGWINLSSFYADMEDGTVSCSADVARLLKRLMKENIEGLVIDLRGDGGGSLEEAIKLTGLFIPRGPVVQAKDWKDNITWRDAENERPMYEGPLIVLTDKASASASEIFAGALQDYRRALVIGEQSTFGKGTVQTILPVERYMPFFSDKSRAGALKVTIQKFYRIAGGSTQLKGVIPDIQIPSLRDVMEIGEASLPHALPYDTIPARTYTYFSKKPLPLEDLRSRSIARVTANPEFQYILEDMKRFKERIDKNSVSLNLEERRNELKENKERVDIRKEERKKRVQELNEKLAGSHFTEFRLTLDNVDQESLPEQSKFSKEEATGMRLASSNNSDEDEDTSADDSSKFPYGIEPVKLETLFTLQDLIEISHSPSPPQTAEANKKE